MSNSPAPFSPFWPITILAVSFLLLASWQLSSLYPARLAYNERLKSQNENVEKAKKMLGDFDKFYDELFELAKTDPDVKSLTDRLPLKRISPKTAQ